MSFNAKVQSLEVRALANGGLETLQDIARRKSTIGGRATTQNVKTRSNSSRRAIFESLENAGLIEANMGYQMSCEIILTDAGRKVLESQ
jgi:hypothetical protein